MKKKSKIKKIGYFDIHKWYQKPEIKPKIKVLKFEVHLNLNEPYTNELLFLKTYIDQAYIGTKHYKGHAWFWASCILKFQLREFTPQMRREAHNTFIKQGLDLLEDDEEKLTEHLKILDDIELKYKNLNKKQR
jgi:hypothetical protein